MEKATRRILENGTFDFSNSVDCETYMYAVEIFQRSVLLGGECSVEILQTRLDSVLMLPSQRQECEQQKANIETFNKNKLQTYASFEDICQKMHEANADKDNPDDSSSEAVSSPDKDSSSSSISVSDDESSSQHKESSSIFEDDSSSEIVSTPDEDFSSGETSVPDEDSSSSEISVPGESSSSDEEVAQPSVGLKYELSEDGTYYTVTGIDTCTDTEIVIPSTYKDLPVTSIGDDAFLGCESLTSVVIGDNVTSIGSWAFGNCDNLASVTIGDGVISIGFNAFTWCKNLTSVVIGDSVTSVGDTAFAMCDSLKSITVDENNIVYCSVEGNLYSKDKTKLIQYAIGKTATSFTIPDSVMNIGYYAFDACSSLTSIVIGDSVTSIGDGAFANCVNLTSIEIPDSVTSIGVQAFSCCNLLASITVDENNSEYCSIDGNLYNKDKTELIQYAIGKENTSFIIPNSVTSISDCAFADCLSLKNIEIPDSVTSIASYVFSGCSNLTEVILPCGITEIKDLTFQHCDSLTEMVIPEGVTLIDWLAFYGCDNLASVVIPESVTRIGEEAFGYCARLESITFNGTVEQWNAIEKDTGWNEDVPATEVVCLDGTVEI